MTTVDCALIRKNGPMDDEDGPERHLLSLDSIKMMAESVGITGLQEEAGKRLSEDLEFRLKEVRYRGKVVSAS